MELAEFHISAVMAVVFNEVGLSKEGLWAFCDLLQFMTGDDSDDVWNSESARIICSDSLLEQEPGLESIYKYPVQAPGKELWWQRLEDRFGPYILVSKVKGGIYNSKD